MPSAPVRGAVGLRKVHHALRDRSHFRSTRTHVLCPHKCSPPHNLSLRNHHESSTTHKTVPEIEERRLPRPSTAGKAAIHEGGCFRRGQARLGGLCHSRACIGEEGAAARANTHEEAAASAWFQRFLYLPPPSTHGGVFAAVEHRAGRSHTINDN
jgi:hypothetical protein